MRDPWDAAQSQGCLNLLWAQQPPTPALLFDYLRREDNGDTCTTALRWSQDRLVGWLKSGQISAHWTDPETGDTLLHVWAKDQPFTGSLADPELAQAWKDAHEALVPLPRDVQAGYRNHAGQTPLHAFMTGDYPDIKRLDQLLAMGFGLDTPDHAGRTPLDLARQRLTSRPNSKANRHAQRDYDWQTPLQKALSLTRETHLEQMASTGRPATKGRVRPRG